MQVLNLVLYLVFNKFIMNNCYSSFTVNLYNYIYNIGDVGSPTLIHRIIIVVIF